MKDNDIALLPCPFCGSSEAGTFQHVGDDGPEELYRGSCWNCVAGTDWQRTPDEAIAVWNNRPAPSPWVPCSERLPEFSNEVWLTVVNPDLFIKPVVTKGRYRCDLERWQILGFGVYGDLPEGSAVIAWQDIEPTPAPYQPQQAETETK